jgi:hypothetical protein
VYSILASFQPRWGWPRTMPHGDGEEESSSHPPTTGSLRRLMMDDPNHLFVPRMDSTSITLDSQLRLVHNPLDDFGKLVVMDEGNAILSSVDIIEFIDMVKPPHPYSTNCVVVFTRDQVMGVEVVDGIAEIKRTEKKFDAGNFFHLCNK